MTNPYLELTAAFNRNGRRALISSGQAVVLHRLAVMSKDGDWILQEDEETARHVLDVLARAGSRYRFGAPLDVRWLRGGWSVHLEHWQQGLRLRTDFVSRPPRLTRVEREAMWRSAEVTGDVVGLEPLARMKMTRREKDYPVIGELARRMPTPALQFRYSRSSRDLIHLAHDHPEVLADVIGVRPVLTHIAEGREALDAELDRERRELMRADEARLSHYRAAAAEWESRWPAVSRAIAGLELHDAHAVIVSEAEKVLPFTVAGIGIDD